MMMVKAPAKINLSLDVLHKRPDGFHEVEMVMTTVDLADRIELDETKGTRIRIISHDRFVPSDHRNLAYKAAEKLQKKYNVKKGVDITIHKQIPVAAGLAGGSSDAAAALKGLNELWSLGLSNDELAEVGSEIGSDVAFCIYGGTAFATGRGEKIQELPTPPKCWVILAKPSIGVSTADIYQNLKLEKVEHPNTAKMVQAIEEGDYQGVCDHLGNALESVTLQLYPEVKHIKEQMQRFGADAVLMSGSGPTVFGLVQYESKVHRVVNGLRGFCDQVFAVRMLGSRAPLA